MLCYSGYSQEIRSYVISSTGAAIMGDAGALYLSIGEPMSTEISDGDIMISQGFLQVSISESTDNKNILQEIINVFPNPTSSNLILELPEMKGDYEFQIFNKLGAHVQVGQINSRRTTVDMNSFNAGTYFLRVTKGMESSKTVKIVKL